MGLKSVVDEMINEFAVEVSEGEHRTERMVSVRLPDAYKLKYAIIQARTGKKASELLRLVVMATIDQLERASNAS